MSSENASPEAAPAETTPEAAPATPELSPADCGARLAELFPALFGGPPKPIKLRVHADIQQRAPGIFTKKTLSIFFHRHTTSTAYLKALVAATERVDLDGAPAGEIADEHRNAAVAELERRRAIVEAKRQAGREAHRAAEQARRQTERQTERQQRDAEFEARRERAALLRAFETTTLTRANFCALKGIPEAELDARLAQARTEREQRPPREERPGPPRGERGERGDRPPPRRDGPRPPQRAGRR